MQRDRQGTLTLVWHLSRLLARRPSLGEPAPQEDVQRQADHCQAADDVNVVKQHPH